MTSQFKIERRTDNRKAYNVLYKGNFTKAGTIEDVKKFINDTNSKPKEYRDKFYCLPNCTECCHQHILITEAELFKIRRALRNTNKEEIERLKGQARDPGVCPLLDIENKTCSVYNSRPDVCRDFGTCTGAMACSYNMDVYLDPVEEYFLKEISNRERTKGRLGVDFTWKKGLVRNE